MRIKKCGLLWLSLVNEIENRMGKEWELNERWMREMSGKWMR